MHLKMLAHDFFVKESTDLAIALLGKVMCVRQQDLWLYAQIIETEAYYRHEKASHSSLGFTEKRKAMFMEAGTIYMYYSRGGDSINISAAGEGNAVLIKSGIPYPLDDDHYPAMIRRMQQLNPAKSNLAPRHPMRLCSGQTLLCRSLGLRVSQWNQQQLDEERFFIADANYAPASIIQTTRLGIAPERDAHLPYRFLDEKYVAYATKNPLTQRNAILVRLAPHIK